MEGTWFQLMCCTPSQSRCLKFRSNGDHEVHEGILEFTGEDGEDQRFAQMGALWSIYELVLSYMIPSYMYPWECMYLRKKKDNKTVMEHNKHNNPKWNITRIPEFWIGVKSENGEQQN